jgi:hypothetical protein
MNLIFHSEIKFHFQIASADFGKPHFRSPIVDLEVPGREL